jgi:hypothetical protein
MTFANGWTVSVQFGPGNYCERSGVDYSAPSKVTYWTSGHAEVAAWNSDNEWLPFDHDTVKGWNTSDEVAAFISRVAALTPDFHPGPPKGWDMD